MPSACRATRAALCLILLGAGAGCRPAAADDRPQQARGAGVPTGAPAKALVAGTSREYALILESRADFAPDRGASASAFGFTLTATLELAKLPDRGGEQERRVQLKGASLNQGKQARPELEPLARELEKPWLYTAREGSVTALRFERGLSGQAVALLRTVAATLQAPALAAGKPAVVREYDATGQYEAEYRLDGDTVVKTKTRYTGLLTTGPIREDQRAAMMPRVLSARSKSTFRSGDLVSVASEEQLESELLPGKPIVSKTALTLTWIRNGAPPSVDRSALLAKTTSLPAAAPYGDAPRRDHFDDVRIQGLTVEQALARFFAARKKTADAREDVDPNAPDPNAAGLAATAEEQRADYEAFAALVALVRREPKALSAVLAAVRTASGDMKKALYDVLGNAGTKEAQQALARVVVDVSAGDAIRRGAAMSLIRVKEATDETVATLTALVGDRLLREHAIYGLGTAARRLREVGRTVAAGEIRGVLGALMENAGDDLERLRVARGIANSADPALLAFVRPLFTNSSVKLRQVALQAVQHMDHAEVDGLLARRLLEDASPLVRGTAATVAGARSRSAELVDAMKAVARADVDRMVRYRAVEALATWVAEEPELRGVLAGLEKTETEAKIRDAARRGLRRASAAHADVR